MNWQHLLTFLWLRRRLTANHIRRHGALNFIILAIGGGMALAGSVIGFVFAIVAGVIFLPDASPVVLMYVCDGWVIAFLFFWMMGVITELQRGEMLSLEKLLHLPTTLVEVFGFNFLASLVSMTTLTFVPPMLGLCIAAVLTGGPAALVMFPLTAAFVLMVCAVTYQFRGWLATLMTNKRRQRTVMVVVTFVFVLAMQVPQLINVAVQRQIPRWRAADRSSGGGPGRNQDAGDMSQAMHHLVETVNLALPIGWPAYGAKAAFEGNAWPGLAGTLGMAGITAFCLRRSYRTTLRYFTGDLIGKAARVPAAQAPATSRATAAGAGVLEWRIPFVAEPTAAVACATFRSLARAPEVKLVLMGPLIMPIFLGAMLLPNLEIEEIPTIARALLPLGLLGVSISGLASLSQNMFANDRSGFRAYALSGVSRRRILIGKNLAFAPLIFIPSLLLLMLAQLLVPARASHFAAVLLTVPTVYLLLCLLGNFSSIVCPVGQAAGSLKPANARGLTILLQVVFVLAITAALAVVALVPFGLEWLLHFLEWIPTWVPVALIVSSAQLAAGVLLYRIIIRTQGELLQFRECRILEAVTERGE